MTLKQIMKILFFETEKINKFINVIYGVRDGFMRRFGKRVY